MARQRVRDREERRQRRVGRTSGLWGRKGMKQETKGPGPLFYAIIYKDAGGEN